MVSHNKAPGPSTCDYIFGPRLIPAVSWGHPAYIMHSPTALTLKKTEFNKEKNNGMRQ